MKESFDEDFDVIVIGAGHAGCEAASVCARMGCETALVTLSLEMIGQMSCNPAVGGIAKGHLVREIDALGGIMGRIIDRTGIQFRLLNRSRGPAVQAPRAQADRALYRTEMRHTLEFTPNLHLRQGLVIDLIIHDGRIRGVLLQDTRRLRAKAVVLATGTFLNGLIHTGRSTYQSGRAGEPAAAWFERVILRLQPRAKLAHAARRLRLVVHQHATVIRHRRRHPMQILHALDPTQHASSRHSLLAQ